MQEELAADIQSPGIKRTRYGLLGSRLCLSLIAVLSQSSIAAPAAPSPVALPPVGMVWYEHGLAAVVAGRASKNDSAPAGTIVLHKLYAAMYGPLPSAAGPEATAAALVCSRPATEAIAYRLRQEIDAIVTKTSVTDTDDVKAYEAKLLQRSESLDILFSDLHIRLTRTLSENCPALANSLQAFRPAITLRACEANGAANGCKNPAPDSAWAGSMTATRFAAVVEWLSALRPKESSLELNTISIFGQSDPSLAPNAKTPSKARTVARFYSDSDGADRWHDASGSEERQLAFEAVVDYARRNGNRLPGVVARTWGLSRELVLQTADVLSDTSLVVGALSSVPETQLKVISDEIARARVRECLLYGGRASSADVSKCSGYVLTDSIVTACITNGTCQPTLDLKAMPEAAAAALTIARQLGVKELAVANLLPRATVAGMQWSELERKAEECVGSDAKRATKQAAMNCLAKQLGATQYKDCLGKSTSKEIATCISGGKLPEDVQRMLVCASKGRVDAGCALAASVPREVAEAIECARRFKKPTDVATCALGNGNPRVADLATCLEKTGGADWSSCGTILLGKALPAGVAKLAECVAKNTDQIAAAICAADARVPEDVRRATQCLAQTGGNPTGTAVCMVSDNLNPYQQAALQCAVATGGEPASFATCAGGQLLVARVQGCLADDFGSGRCFGENNDFQKIVKALTGTTIKPNSLVGKVINANIDVVRVTVALTGKAADEVERFGKDLERHGKNLEKAAKKFERELSRAGRDIEQFQRKVFKAAAPELLEDFVDNPGKTVVNAIRRPDKALKKIIKL